MTDLATLIPVLEELSVDNRNLLTRLDAIVTTGKPGAGVGAVGSIAIDMTAKVVYGPKASSGADPWGDGDPFAAGADGREVELQASATHIQWRYVGDPTWTDLIALSLLTGADGEDGVDGDDGDDGWTPVLAVESDDERRVHRVVDWTGGTGTKPATGQYIGPSGFVTLIGDAVDIRGAQGTSGGGTGDLLAANNLADVASVATSRTNLSVYSKAEVDTLLAAAGGTFDPAAALAAFDAA